MAASDTGQLAVVQELQRRRESLNPDQQAIVDELTRRFNLPPVAMNTAPIPEGLRQPEEESLLKRIYLAPARAITEGIPAAIAQYTRPGLDPKLAATSNLLRGVGTAAAPFTLPDALVAAPAMTAASIGTGMLGSGLAGTAADVVGLPPGATQLAEDVGGVLGGGAPYALKRTGVTPKLSRGAKEAVAEVRKEAPQIKQWQKAGSIGGAAIGGLGGHPYIGTGVGAAAGTARAIPPALRGFSRGFNAEMPAPPTIDYTIGSGELSIPGVGPRPTVASVATIPHPPVDYTMGTGELSLPGVGVRPITSSTVSLPEGLVRSNEAFPSGGTGKVAKQLRKFTPGKEEYGPAHGRADVKSSVSSGVSSGPLGNSPPADPYVDAVLKQTAKNLGAANFTDLPVSVQEAVKADLAKQGIVVQSQMPAPPGTLPTPGVNPQSLIPEGEHAIIRQVSENLRSNKDLQLARYFKTQGITPEQVQQMPKADYDSHVRAAGFRPSSGRNYSREWESARKDLVAILKSIQ